ncbi:MAG: hypothetical protein DYG96_04135 [Chlorobi bacterium CHB2]|nr:hypothetical protein [Chlorobi bacterium CHB2]
MNQKTISNLGTPSGRRLYQDLWHDLIIEQRSAVVPSLLRLLRTAISGAEVRIVSKDASFNIGHPLGLRHGFRLFMEEIVVRHYFNNVQALVYFGAVLLLVFLGLRFAGLLSEEVALIGIGIEACMLLILFLVLFYSPEDNHHEIVELEVPEADATNDDEDARDVIREVLDEIEDIGGTYATLGMKMEQLARTQEESIRELAQRVAAIQGLNLLESHAERLETTNTLLSQLTAAIDGMNQRIDMMFGKELEYHVRREMERMLRHGANGAEGATPMQQREGAEQ